MLKYLSYALLLATVQANLNVVPKIFKMQAIDKGFDSSELTVLKPITVAQNTKNNQIVTQTIKEHDLLIVSQVTEIPKIQLNDTRNDNEDKLIKRILFNLVKNCKLDVDRKMATIDKVHDNYKDKRLYRIGYIVSFLNKTYEDITDAYKFVDDNKNNWNILRILNSYEKVKNGNEFVSVRLP